MATDPVVLRLLKLFLCLLTLIAFGTLGYVVVEGWTLRDGFYMTMITLSTVGYGETRELTQTGRLFTSGLIFLCLIGVSSWTAALTSFIVESDMGGTLVQRRIIKMVAKLKDHTIVCGSGMMAQAVIDTLVSKRISVVVVDNNEEQLALIRRRYRQVMVIEEDATNEISLAKANVMEAKHVVAAMDAEIDNLLIGITCKDMGREILVYAKSNDMTISNRMRKAGIDEVISPFQLGGNRVAQLILG